MLKTYSYVHVKHLKVLVNAYLELLELLQSDWIVYRRLFNNNHTLN